MAFVFFLFSALLWPLRFLFRSADQQQAPQPAPRFEMPPADSGAAPNCRPGWEAPFSGPSSSAVVAYLLLSYLNAHGLLSAFGRGNWLRLRFWWKARWARVSASARKATDRLRKRLRLRRPAPLRDARPLDSCGQPAPGGPDPLFLSQHAQERRAARPGAHLPTRRRWSSDRILQANGPMLR